MIRAVFPAPAATSTATATVGTPAADVQAYARTLFGQIADPVAKLDAFKAVMESPISTDDITRSFYNLLDASTQTAFKRNVYVANGRNDRGLGMNFGDTFVAGAEIRSALALQGLALLRAEVAAGPSTSAGTTGTGP